MYCRLPPWNQESLKKNIFYVTTYDQYSNYIWVTLVSHIPWISHYLMVDLDILQLGGLQIDIYNAIARQKAT